MLMCAMGKEGVPAYVVAQEPWHVIDSRVTEEGIVVETAGENLMLHAGVTVKADSAEGTSFGPELVRDGIREDAGRRWSSANDWEKNEHWLEVSFPQEVTVGLVRIFWERTNASSYALECSADGKNWEQIAAFLQSPSENVQDIRLEEPVKTRFLRLHVTEVAKREEDLSLYYQNVSVLELEVYEGIADVLFVQKPEVGTGRNRRLDVSGLLEGSSAYALEFAGADYETLVRRDGTIADTIGETEVQLGFALVRDGVRRELPGLTVKLPANTGSAAEQAAATEQAAAEIEQAAAATGQAAATEQAAVPPGQKAALPSGFFAKEATLSGGSYRLGERTRVVVDKKQEEELLPCARLFAAELSALLNREVETVSAAGISGRDSADITEEDIVLTLCGEGEALAAKLGQEGYALYLQTSDSGFEVSADGGQTYGAVGAGGTQIAAVTTQGLRWGCVSLMELLKAGEQTLPRGVIQDYPRYSVRGFGIDVGRRAISLDFLYELVRELSAHKMNTLQVHLNDNQIISQSAYDGTVEGARSLYAGFRLESEQKNRDGVSLTSTDLYYTKEAFAQFVADAAVYGVEVVPEIDTPAHSLALTKVFPELGLSKNPESADCLDLSKPAAVQLGKDLWSEYLEEAVFADCTAVHIGMDEYFGKEQAYISYLTELAAHVQKLAPQKEIRIWGSLSKITANHAAVPKNLQMHIWDTDWADPQEMYEEGFPIINSLSSSLYLIPGGGYDWLDMAFLKERWQPNVFETAERSWELPAYSERMLGACYMMWNDWTHVNGKDITEKDLFARFAGPLPVIAEKLWGQAGEKTVPIKEKGNG